MRSAVRDGERGDAASSRDEEGSQEGDELISRGQSEVVEGRAMLA